MDYFYDLFLMNFLKRQIVSCV